MARIMFEFYKEVLGQRVGKRIHSEVFTSRDQAETFLDRERKERVLADRDGDVADIMKATIHHIAGHSVVTFRRNPSGSWGKVGELVHHGLMPSRSPERWYWKAFWAFIERQP